MSAKKFKKLIDEYTYNELGFPIILKNVLIIEDNGYQYPLINHEGMMMQAAYSLVLNHQKIDGARLHFIRRFLGMSLDEISEVIGGISKSTLHKWESDPTKVCDLSSEQLRRIYLELRNCIVFQIGKKLDREIAKEFSSGNDLSLLTIDKTILPAG
jgi:DNA-binding transcriptional regulator YiaG